ncbi:MAG: C-type lectin domain-containing protein [Archangium sp.]|nr:C-type lectin domain-containing protein [Archangium sp.]
MSLHARILITCSLVLTACPAEEEGAPPIFNAIDPSLQCPSDKVGWDFSTGGNETDIVPIRVGSEIKVQIAQVTCIDTNEMVDLTASFRADCDNSAVCKRPLARPTDPFTNASCPRRFLKLKYKCGNEPKEYDLSLLNWGNSLSSGAQQVIEKNPANLATDPILLACSDVINTRGYAVETSNGSYSTIYKDRNQCNGLRRCFSNQKSDLGTIGSTIGVSTKYYYTCGTSTAVRESIARRGEQRIDYSCAEGSEQTAFERAPALFIKDVSFTAQVGGNGEPTTTLNRLTRDLKANCESRRSCEVDLNKAELGEAWGTFKVEYWCGTSRGVTEKKYFHVREVDMGLNKLALRCGGRLKIADGSEAWVAQQCPDGSRVCSVPPNLPDARINFFCEGTDGAMANTQWVYRTENYTTQLRSRSLECPLESQRSGIQLIRRVSTGGDPFIDDISACNNKTSCLINNLGEHYSYRCSGTEEVKTSTAYVSGGQNKLYLDCRPRPRVTEISGCITPPNSQLACLPVASDGCTVSLTGTNASAATVRACTTDINVKYTCGSDATVLSRAVGPGSFPATASPDGGELGVDGGSLFNFTVECPYDPSPRPTATSKACIPKTCPKNTRRNAQMECEQDSSIVVYPFLGLVPFFRNPATWAEVTEVKEGFPYIKTIGMFYSGSPAVTQSQAGTLWAYDVFKRKDGTGPEIPGFRCIVSTPTVNWANGNYAALGDWQSNQASVLPSTCFNAPYGDVNSSWYHGSRMVSVNEQTFRNNYALLRTMVVGNFDTRGRAIESWRNAPNPVGFFYTPATGYVNQLAYFAQQSDFRYQKAFRFSDSTQIEMVAVSGRLDQPPLEIGVESFSKPPTLQMNFGWALLGDSPMHPHSPNTRLLNAERTSLKYLNPRATLEIAKEDATLGNKWAAENMAVVGSVGLRGGNPQEQIERLTLKLNPDILKRIMSVKGGGTNQRADGWMSNRIEVNSVFKARVCLDFDGIARAPGQTDIDNKFISATVGGTTYKLGVTRRCSSEFAFTVIRDIFPKPVLPVNATERGIDKGTTTGQGGGRVSSNSDQASQQGCRRQCTANADCGAGGVCTSGNCAQTTENVECSSGYRAGSTTGGSLGFGRSIFSAQSSGSTNSMTRTSTASNRSNVELMSYNLLSSDEQQAGQTMVGGTRSEVRLSLARIWSSVSTIADKLKDKKTAPTRVWYKPAVMKPRGTDSTLPGLAFGISVDGPIFAGPVYLQGEFSLSVALGFDIVLKFISDTQKQSNMNNPAYPCLGTAACLQLSSDAKSFVEANEDCRLKGGRLVEVRTAAALTSTQSAAAGNNVWIGGQAAHVFDDPTCASLSGTGPLPGITQSTLAARMSSCKAASVSQYQWVTGNTPFADAQPNGTLFNLKPANHGFGTGLTHINNDDGSPLAAGLLYKTNGALEAHRSTTFAGTLSAGGAVTTARYVCEYLPAKAYQYNEVSLTPGVEFSFGAGAAVCWPSTVIGACLGAEIKFFTAGVSIEMANRSMKIYDTEVITGVQPRATIGSHGSTAKVEYAFLSGSVGVEIRFFIGSKNFNIVSYSGVAGDQAVLWEDVDRFAR